MSKADDILERLKRSFNSTSSKDERIKVVLVCIVISTTFWFFNALNKSDYVTRINYPVSIQFDQQVYVATNELPDRVTIEVSGGGWDLMTRYFGFKMNPIELEVEQPDLNGFIPTSGLRSQIAPELEPISINYFLEDTVRFQVEKIVIHEVVLQYNDSEVSLSEDFQRTSDININPSTIELKGPESTIEAIGDTLWLQEEIDGISEDFEDEISLPELPELVSASQTSVDVSFLVVEMLSMRVSQPINKVNFPDTLWQIEPLNIEVYYRVPETSLDVTDTSGISLFVDYNLLDSDSTIIIQTEVKNEFFQNVQLSQQRVKAKRNE